MSTIKNNELFFEATVPSGSTLASRELDQTNGKSVFIKVGYATLAPNGKVSLEVTNDPLDVMSWVQLPGSLTKIVDSSGFKEYSIDSVNYDCIRVVITSITGDIKIRITYSQRGES